MVVVGGGGGVLVVEVDEGADFEGDLDWTGLIMSSSSSRSASSGFWVVAWGT